MALTSGFPMVSVPVLSKTTASIFPALSRAAPLLIRIPERAPRPIPTMTAIGVASPSAQGQAMTSTASVKARASAKSAPASSQPTRVALAMVSTVQTK